MAINESVSHRRTSGSWVARRLRPVNRLSMLRTAIPTKKHHVAGEDFLRSTLATASSRQRIAAANGRAEKTVMLFMMEPRGFSPDKTASDILRV